MAKKLISVCIIVILILSLGGVGVSAAENTTYTYTISVDGEWIRTQDAYVPSGVLLKGAGLTQPTDLFFHKGELYITDTDNGRMARYDIKSGKLTFFGEDVLKHPRGVFVTENGDIYVADDEKEAVVIFSSDYKIKQIIERPQSYLFSSQSAYKPVNVAVSSQGNIFVIGEGAYEGIMQFDSKGEFHGYFAANKYTMTLQERFQDMFLSEEQEATLLVRTPRVIQNIDMSNRDLIFSVTQSADNEGAIFAAEKTENSIKLHNMAGTNILSRERLMDEEWNFVDVAAGPYGNVYALTNSGLIDEYDSSGNLIFSFGGRATAYDRNGLFTFASAIDVDDETGFIYVLDKERALVQIFYPNDFAVLNHQAIYDLEQGNYSESQQTWESLLRLNGLSKIAHLGYGKTLFYQQKFTDALKHFKIANDTKYYSEAFWELRNSWLHNNILYIIIAVIALLAFSFVKKAIRKKHPAKETKAAPEGSLAITCKRVGFAGFMLRHPLDGYYYAKREERAGPLSATILYLLAFGVYLLDMLGRGYIFRLVDIKATEPITLVMLFFIPLLLWITGSYMLSSINDGEGSLRNVYVSTAYALSPYIILTPFIVLLTHVLTLNESFIVTLGWIFILAWSVVLLFLSVKEIQQFTVGETIKNIVLTIFYMILVVVAVAIIYLLWNQAISFFKELFGEVGYRVQN